MVRYGLPLLPTDRATGDPDPAADYNALAARLNTLGDPLYLPIGMRTAWADIHSDLPVLSIRCDDIPAADVTGFANLRARHLTAGMGVVEDNIGQSGKLTLAQARDIQQQGFESMNHSRRHSNPAPAVELLYDDLILSAYRMRALNLWVETFVMPGFYDGILQTMAQWDEPLGRAMQGSHIAAMSYLSDSWRLGIGPRGMTPFGANYAGGPMSAAEAQTVVDQLVAAGPSARICLLYHQGGSATDASFFTNMNLALDVIAAARDAGDIQVMTPTAMLLAKHGTPVNLCPEPSFGTLATTPANSVWTADGTTTFGGGESNDGASAITASNTGLTLNMGEGIVQCLRVVEVTARARSAGGTGTATARVAYNVKNGSTRLGSGATDFAQTFALDGTWTTIRTYMGTDPAATSGQLFLGGTGVEYDNVSMIKT